MPKLGDSLKLYITYVGQRWWQIAIGVFAAVISLVADIWVGLRIPTFVWLGAGIAALVAAQFTAFRRLHVDLSTQLNEASSTIDEMKAEAQMPYQMAMHTLSTSFDLHSFKSLNLSQRGLVIRCIVGSTWDGDQLELPGELKTDLRDRMVASPPEHLLYDALNASKGLAWHVTDPTGLWAVTLARKTDHVSNKGVELDSEFLFQVPYPGPRRGWIATIFDIVLRSVGDSPSHIWDLPTFYDFILALIEAVAEMHVRSISHIHDEEMEVAGPVVAFASRGSRLEDFVEYPHWDRAIGVSGTSYFTIDSRDQDKVTGADEREAFVKSQLLAYMSQEGFVGFEPDFHRLVGT